MLLTAALLPLIWQAQPARAQIEWEYTAYDIKVYLSLARAPEFTPALRESVERDLETWAESWYGAVWTLDALPPPAALAVDMPLGLELVDIERIETLDEDVLRADKLFLAAVAEDGAGYRICVRELDCRTRVWGPVYQRRTAQLSTAAALVFDGLVESFTPLARVERVIGRSIDLRLRAGGMIAGPSPAAVADDAVFRAVIRRNDPRISLKPEFTEIVPWTWLQSKNRRGAIYECNLVSGVRSALSGRSGRRTEKLALLARPQFEQTTLKLVSSAKPPQPLIGYEVYERGIDHAAVDRVFKKHCTRCHGFKTRQSGLRLDTYEGILAGGKNGEVVYPANSIESPLMLRLLETDPGLRMPKEGEPLAPEEIDLIRRWIDGRALQESEPQLVALSDFDGAVDVPPAGEPIRTLYIKHGVQRLARLPVMPGVEAELTAVLPEDDVRLEAEGAVVSLQRSYLDAVTRREVLAVKIRKQIKDREFTQAEESIRQLRSFATRGDFTNRLDLRRRDFLTSDSRTQSRIDLMFADAREMMNQHLDPSLPEVLTQELSQARGGR
jgi:hypothetical protein